MADLTEIYTPEQIAEKIAAFTPAQIMSYADGSVIPGLETQQVLVMAVGVRVTHLKELHDELLRRAHA